MKFILRKIIHTYMKTDLFMTTHSIFKDKITSSYILRNLLRAGNMIP